MQATHQEFVPNSALIWIIPLATALLQAIEVSDDSNHSQTAFVDAYVLCVFAWKYIELDDIFWTATKRDHHCHLYGELHPQTYPKQGLKNNIPWCLQNILGGLELLQFTKIEKKLAVLVIRLEQRLSLMCGLVKDQENVHPKACSTPRCPWSAFSQVEISQKLPFLW